MLTVGVGKSSIATHKEIGLIKTPIMMTIHKMPTIGTEGLIKAVFGVAYTQDVDELSKKLENVESHLESDVKVV